jgi:hypothetical protein
VTYGGRLPSENEIKAIIEENGGGFSSFVDWSPIGTPDNKDFYMIGP